jgi:predicted GNAT superfamily acetyltransferase
LIASEEAGLSSRAEKSWRGLSLRSCHTVGEFRQAVALEKEVWGFDDLELIPARFFVVGEKIGGHLLGAYDGNIMVAFVFGLPGVRRPSTPTEGALGTPARAGRVYLHSHMLAVKEPLRNTGLGREMKLFQRELALAEGYDLIEWTFDPLEIKNAYFNMEKLGAVARHYVVNQYGLTTSPLQGGLPSDRLVAEWWLSSPRVEETLRTGKRPETAVSGQVEIPAQIYRWKAQSETRALAAEAQRRAREQFQKYFAEGLTVVGYERAVNGDGRFLVGQWTP